MVLPWEIGCVIRAVLQRCRTSLQGTLKQMRCPSHGDEPSLPRNKRQIWKTVDFRNWYIKRSRQYYVHATFHCCNLMVAKFWCAIHTSCKMYVRHFSARANCNGLQMWGVQSSIVAKCKGCFLKLVHLCGWQYSVSANFHGCNLMVAKLVCANCGRAI